MKNQTKKGFTLIEALLAIAIFSILVAVGVGGFVNALRTQREVASLISVYSNASTALEQMARDIRTGYLFCNDPNNNGNPNAACQPVGNDGCLVNGNVWTCNNILDFYNANGVNVDYRLSGGSLERSQTGLGGFVPVTGNNVRVAYLTFTLFGNTEGDHWPPRIAISMGVAPNSTDPAIANSVLNLETSVSARGIDCTGGGSC